MILNGDFHSLFLHILFLAWALFTNRHPAPGPSISLSPDQITYDITQARVWGYLDMIDSTKLMKTNWSLEEAKWFSGPAQDYMLPQKPEVNLASHNYVFCGWKVSPHVKMEMWLADRLNGFWKIRVIPVLSPGSELEKDFIFHKIKVPE